LRSAERHHFDAGAGWHLASGCAPQRGIEAARAQAAGKPKDAGRDFLGEVASGKGMLLCRPAMLGSASALRSTTRMPVS